LIMDGYVAECFREHVRNIGLPKDTHGYDGVFPKKDGSESMGKETIKEALSATQILRRYCKGNFRVDERQSCLPSFAPDDETSIEITVPCRKGKM